MVRKPECSKTSTRNDLKNGKAVVANTKDEPNESEEDVEKEFKRRTETVKRARRKSATLMQPYVSDFNFESSHDDNKVKHLNKQHELQSKKVPLNDGKKVTRGNKICPAVDRKSRKDEVVRQEPAKPKCSRDFTEEIKRQMRTRSKEIQGNKAIKISSPVKNVVTSERTKTYLQECSVPIFSPHIFTCDSIKKLTRQQLSQGSNVKCSSPSIPHGKLTQEIKELKHPAKGDTGKNIRKSFPCCSKDADQFTKIKPRKIQQQSDFVTHIGGNKTYFVSEKRYRDGSDSPKGNDSVGTRSRSRLSLQNDSGIEVDSIDSPIHSEHDSKVGKVNLEKKCKEQEESVTEKPFVSSRKRSRVCSKVDDKLQDEPLIKALKPDGTTLSPVKPDKVEESEMCKHEQLVTKCDTCAKNVRSRTTSPMPLYDNNRKTVRQIIHGGKVFEITKGSVTEREIQMTRQRAKEEQDNMVAGSSSVRARTRGINKTVSSVDKKEMKTDSTQKNQGEVLAGRKKRTITVTQKMGKDELSVGGKKRNVGCVQKKDRNELSMRGTRKTLSSTQKVEENELSIGGKRESLNEYIHNTLKEIKKQRESENSKKWTVKKESPVKAPKFPYAFKKSRRN